MSRSWLRWAVPAALAVSACSDGNQPVLVDQQVTTDEDVPVDIKVLDGASDPNDDPLTVILAYAGSQRTDIIDGAIVRVIPAPDFNGVILVNYRVSDGNGPSVTGSATVAVRPVNDPPIAAGATLNLHDRATISLTGVDVEGATLTYQVVTGPAHGTLTGTAPILQYTPETGFVGDDAITYRVSDGSASSEPATIQLHVGPGSAPAALAATLTGTEDRPLGVILQGSDPDRDPLTFTVVTSPEHGTLSGTAPNLVYTPAPEFGGSDSLAFSVSDGYLSSGIAIVTINVTPVNDAPVATPRAIAATEDITSTITLEGTDVEGDTLTFQVPAPPSHGTLSGAGATRTYTPAPNYHGPDSFTFTAFDGKVTSAPATVTIGVASVEDPPVARLLSVSVTEDTPTSVVLQGSDGDADPITFAIATPPAHGTLSGTAPALTYTPAANFNGSDSFSYTVSDPDQTSLPATVFISGVSVNDAPVAVGSSVTTLEDTPVAITLQASDVDGQTLSFTIATPPGDGTLTGSGTSWTYTPAPNATGTRSFVFRASDGSLSALGTIAIEITPVNDPPTTRDDFVATDPGTPITFNVTSNDVDVEGDTVQLDSVEAPAHGTIAIVGGQLHYTPDAGFTGLEVFAYTVVDPLGAASTGNAHVGAGTFPPGAPIEAIATAGGSITTTSASRAPAISSDGRYVAFTSALPLVNDDTKGFEDVYLYDRGTRTLTRVSVASDGSQSNAGSFFPTLSADGRYVVFQSSANNLVAGDTNETFDVFRHDRVTGETIRVSVATGGGQASGSSADPEVSEDGRLVVFASSAFDLIPFGNDANGATDIFVRDVTAGTTERVSISTSGGEADLGSLAPTISGDGRFVAFSSQATNLVSGDTNNVFDVFLRDRVAGTTVRVSVSSTGGQADRQCINPSLSRDGRFISFLSDATTLVTGAPAPVQLYLRDVQGGTTTRPVSTSLSIGGARLSGDGRYVTAFSSAGTFIRDRFAAITSTPPGSSRWFWPMISGTGRYVVVLDTSNGSVTVTPNPL